MLRDWNATLRASRANTDVEKGGGPRVGGGDMLQAHLDLSRFGLGAQGRRPGSTRDFFRYRNRIPYFKFTRKT